MSSSLHNLHQVRTIVLQTSVVKGARRNGHVTCLIDHFDVSALIRIFNFLMLQGAFRCSTNAWLFFFRTLPSWFQVVSHSFFVDVWELIFVFFIKFDLSFYQGLSEQNYLVDFSQFQDSFQHIEPPTSVDWTDLRCNVFQLFLVVFVIRFKIV